MSRKTIAATAPSAWAPYLMHGDASGMEPQDVEAARLFVAVCLGGAWPVSCEDAGFLWAHDAMASLPACNVKPADCQTYSALVEGE